MNSLYSIFGKLRHFLADDRTTELNKERKRALLALEEIEALFWGSIRTTANTKFKEKAGGMVVSLTSYGERINTVHLTILSLLLQSKQPDLFVLWLSEKEFKRENLPKKLLELESYGLEIAFCNDIKSYKKLIPSLKKFKGSSIVTFDDDVIYPTNHLERLYENHLKFPKAVVCHRAHRLKADKENNILPYMKWDFDCIEKKLSKDLLPIGIGGILYPANCFDNDVYNDKLFMTLCPNADDLWFKAMALKNNSLVKLVDNPLPYENYLQLPSEDGSSLWDKNKYENDYQLQNILVKYPELLSQLINAD